ncbi:MAG TPA: type VI secretion system-associated FHA domain protein TagH [Variovorax sp.]|nr:type VI secretion system-associated FHA domain protein TagH [Variovorax sp.]
MLQLVVVSLRGAPPGRPIAASFGPGGGTIGRAATNTLVLEDPDRTVSRVHAQVSLRDGRFVISDQGSNPLQHNGRALGAGKEAVISPGDRLVIGSFELSVQGAGETTEAPVTNAPVANAPQPTPDDPFADLLSGLGAPTPAPAPAASAPKAAPSADSLLFPDPMGLAGNSAAQRAAAAPMSADDPFADLLGSGSPAPKPGAIEDFSDLGLRAPDAAAGIDHLFGGNGKAPRADPLALSPLADPLLQPNTASKVDPLLALQQGAPKAAAAPQSDHLSIDHFGFDPPKGIVPSAVPEVDPFADLMPPPAPAARSPQPPPPPPMVAAPLPAPATPVARAAPSAGGDALLAALLRGLNSNHQMPTQLTPELMERIGVLLRNSTEGTLQLLLARTEVKKGVHAEITMIAASKNNPLKFSPTVEVALAHLLGPGMRGFMGAEEAMRDAYDDLRAHEFGVMVGMRAALAHVLARFTPAELEKKIAAKGALDTLFSANRKAKLWDQFVALYGGIAAEAEDDFHSLFGKAFVQAYEEQMARLKSGR